jgi:malonyl-CoA/methylmalonyl-CoA synthetase
MLSTNLYSALRAAFPADLDSLAIETDAGLTYSWRDLDRASAMVANLLASLALPPASRVAVQVEKSVEALVLYLATLRSGSRVFAAQHGLPSSEIEYFIGNAEPAVVVCTPKPTLVGSAKLRSRRARKTCSRWAMTAAEAA